jgi:hypothetical protein
MSDSLKKVNLTGVGLLSTFHLMHYVGSVGVELRALPEKERERIGDLQKGIPLGDNLNLKLSSKQDSKHLSGFPNIINSARALLAFLILKSIRIFCKSKLVL